MSYLFEFFWTLGHKEKGDLLLNLIGKCMFTIKTLDEYGDCCAEYVKSQKVSKLRQSMWLRRLFNPLKTNCPILNKSVNLTHTSHQLNVFIGKDEQAIDYWDWM